jgi:hypothetical protein
MYRAHEPICQVYMYVTWQGNGDEVPEISTLQHELIYMV